MRTTGVREGLRDHGNIADSGGAEYAAVAVDLGWRTERLRIIVRELNRRMPLNLVHLANQADGVEPVIALGITAAEIVGQQCAPTSADSNPPFGDPFSSIEKIASSSEIAGPRAAQNGSAEICM